MTDNDPFDPLRSTAAPAPRPDAKKAALSAGRAAFQAAQKKSHVPTQGTSWGQRLTSIVTFWKGKSIMDMRLPIGTAAIALIVLPLGYQLYSTTALTQGQVPAPRPAVVEQPAPATEAEAPVDAAPAERAETPVVEAAPAAKAAPSRAQELAVAAPEPVAPPPPPTADMDLAQDQLGRAAAPAPATIAPQQQSMQSTESFAPAGALAESDSVYLPAPVPMKVAPTEPSGDQFTSFEEQRLRAVADEPVSTFSIDVDTASYSYVRRMLEDGFVPEPDAVRIEEMINYFPYDYAPADSAEVPFKPTLAVYPTPWNPQTQLLHIGIKGYVPPAEDAAPANLVFLIDTSGSMDEPDKLPLLKRAFGLLVDQLSADDRVSIVVYAGSAGVVLPPTAASDKATILQALDQLWAGGSTAGAEGIELAYRLAEQGRVAGTNRVILATDGDFNVGIDDPQALEDFIERKRVSGISLSVLGFGQGNLDDATMQALAQNGNGNASYISSFREAQKVLVEEVGGTLDTIAKDVKIQVEFNPAAVSEYRLIGYETRALNREDFNNDAVDAGDIGAGHTVTAIYEITPTGSGAALIDPLRYGDTAVPAGDAGEIAFLRMRYKLPDSDVSQLIEQPVTPSVVYDDIGEATDDMRFAAAVAAFAQKLKDSNYGGDLSWADIAALARSGRGEDPSGYRAEFISLIKTAGLLVGE